MSIRFTLHEDDKRLVVTDENDLDFTISVDYDDVYHPAVMRKAELLCEMLNKHFPNDK